MSLIAKQGSSYSSIGRPEGRELDEKVIQQAVFASAVYLVVFCFFNLSCIMMLHSNRELQKSMVGVAPPTILNRKLVPKYLNLNFSLLGRNSGPLDRPSTATLYLTRDGLQDKTMTLPTYSHNREHGHIETLSDRTV